MFCFAVVMLSFAFCTWNVSHLSHHQHHLICLIHVCLNLSHSTRMLKGAIQHPLLRLMQQRRLAPLCWRYGSWANASVGLVGRPREAGGWDVANRPHRSLCPQAYLAGADPRKHTLAPGRLSSTGLPDLPFQHTLGLHSQAAYPSYLTTSIKSSKKQHNNKQ